MSTPPEMDLDWEGLGDLELPEELAFVDLEAQVPLDEQALVEFLKEFEKNTPESSWKVLDIRPVDEGEPDS